MGTRSEGEEALSRVCLGHPPGTQPHRGLPEAGSLYPEDTRAGEGFVCGAGSYQGNLRRNPWMGEGKDGSWEIR